MDAPPIPRLVDLVHAFNGVVVEQFKKRVEKLLSDSIPLWRLLKLLFKILHFLSSLREFKHFSSMVAVLPFLISCRFKDDMVCFSIQADNIHRSSYEHQSLIMYAKFVSYSLQYVYLKYLHYKNENSSHLKFPGEYFSINV